MQKVFDPSTHTLNNSSSKTKYSFPKTTRFYPQLHKPLECDTIYELPNIKSSRTSSFGQAIRNPQKIDSQTVLAKFYDIPRDFDRSNIIKKRGFSFGSGRQKTVGGIFVNNEVKDFPGPGSYNIKKIKQQPLVTIKFQQSQRKFKQPQEVPGPGAYEPSDQINNKGKYFLSKYKNSYVCRFNPLRKSQSVIERSQYKSNSSFEDIDKKNSVFEKADGKQFLPKFSNKSGSAFPRSNRKNVNFDIVSQTPGPGAYHIFSPFDTSTQ